MKELLMMVAAVVGIVVVWTASLFIVGAFYGALIGFGVMVFRAITG